MIRTGFFRIARLDIMYPNRSATHNRMYPTKLNRIFYIVVILSLARLRQFFGFLNSFTSPL
jgi:hypothetical protein